MKKELFQVIIAIVTLSCKAQSPVLDLYESNYGSIQNAYYKDLNNLHDQYLGTWLYTNGTTSLKVIFQKRDQIYIDHYYSDYLIGEYQYIENGIEKVNTLNNINTNYGSNIGDVRKHNMISSGWIKHITKRPQCNECNANEGRLEMSIGEPALREITGLTNNFVLRRFFDNGVEKLKVWFVSDIKQGLVFDANDNPVDVSGFSLPFGTYILTKQ
jgi:hypothetical protein